MLTGYHVAVIGGDARQIELIRRLNEWGATVYLAGFDQLNESFREAINLDFDSHQVEKLDAVILPVPGTDHEGKIEGIFSNQLIHLTEEWLKKTPEHCQVLTGIANDHLRKLAAGANRRLIPLMDRDDVATYNSIPTVEGTLMLVIQHTDFTIHGSKVIVLGLGRVGMTLARTFHHLGAKVFVGVRSSKSAARVFEMGLTPIDMNHLENVDMACDILLNTVPHPVVDASIIKQLPSHAMILDLASKPGGTDFQYADNRGIKALLAPGLPGIVAPKTAGRIIADVVSRLVQEGSRKENG
ncbi:dipicolinate synthase subunit A [Halobacillus karajensis]|uniref:Dipicolinate synthase subunit A n=1 Tax=Halobacillus karajensis TaxID=195088 RepID=A0A024P1X3_9BACI|nr:dipicolinic acid synthetase subunit A [Halobacillus karajensis]CDQ19695.1 Dipicolinate synthase subunit A [Halobacillus karajensis]CDQ22155.1 Dipicolinate synthase subunit A [Halobacillus karajensis]CDQ27996.1 Dipicolinate synthase subunit A [Halobacillus karajensis]SEH73713.1 dipicolinate synthase subunit A [Halobacillus karajensis]